MGKFVWVGLLLALFVLGGVGRVDAGADGSWLDVDERLDSALKTFERGDVDLAIRQLTAVAEAGDSYAQYFLGRLYIKRFGVVYGLGVVKDDCRAAEWFKRAAAQGDAGSMTSLGTAYEFGKCVPRDLDEAAQYFQRAAWLGDAGAYIDLANLHRNLKWGRRDPRQALDTLNRVWDESRKENNLVAVRAAQVLGFFYDYGFGVDRDRKKAESYYKYAARQGLIDAQYELILLNIQEGSLPNLPEALKWMFVAAEQGDRAAVLLRNEMAKTMTANQLAEFHESARKFLWSIAESDTLLSTAADWCRVNRPVSYDCMRFSFADRKSCDPLISEKYFKTRYMHSDAYKVCRREAYEARGLGISQD